MQTTGGGAASRAEDDEVGALALIPMHRPLLKRQKTVRTVSALLLPGDAGGAAASGTHLAIAAVGVQKSPLCTASAEMEHPMAVGRAQARLSIDHPGTAIEAPTSGF